MQTDAFIGELHVNAMGREVELCWLHARAVAAVGDGDDEIEAVADGSPPAAAPFPLPAYPRAPPRLLVV